MGLRSFASNLGNSIANGVKAGANATANAAKKTGKFLNDKIEEDRVMNTAALAQVLENDRNAVEQFPDSVSFSIVAANGVEQKFVSTAVPYDLEIRDRLRHGDDMFYIVQQVSKTDAAKGKYAFVNAQGECLEAETAQGPLGRMFFQKYDLITSPVNDIWPIRGLLNPSGVYQDIGIHLTDGYATVISSTTGTGSSTGGGGMVPVSPTPTGGGTGPTTPVAGIGAPTP